MPPRKQPTRSAPPAASSPTPEIVDPVWLLKAGAGMLGIALVCSYIAICVLFSIAQWQLVLHPTHGETHQPADYGRKADAVTFGADATGQPQLRGWWIAADAPRSGTALMLPSGDGAAGDWLSRAKSLHDAGLNVLLFDYRGAGISEGKHPTEATMEHDAESALAFLQQRRIMPKAITVFGAGAGASIATKLCTEHTDLASLILERADGDFASRARLDPRARIVPFGLLFHQEFPLTDRLQALKTPKLLISYTTGPAPEAFKRAADPKMLLDVPTPDAPGVQAGIQHFLDMR